MTGSMVLVFTMVFGWGGHLVGHQWGLAGHGALVGTLLGAALGAYLEVKSFSDAP